jgi:hypothetical protein
MPNIQKKLVVMPNIQKKSNVDREADKAIYENSTRSMRYDDVPQAELPSSKSGVIYFLCWLDEDKTNPRIKIGYSGNISKRLRDHAKPTAGGTKHITLLLAIVRGGKANENAIHTYFRDHRRDGETETYDPTMEIVGYIRWLRDRDYVWVFDDTLCQPIERLDQIGFDLWQPSTSTHKPPPSPSDVDREIASRFNETLPPG